MAIKRTCFIPTVLLRCSRCRFETRHALIDFKNEPPGLALIYECQACGEVRRLFDLGSLSESSPEHIEYAVKEEKKDVAKEEEKKERPIPIDRGPQIEQYPH